MTYLNQITRNICLIFNQVLVKSTKSFLLCRSQTYFSYSLTWRIWRHPFSRLTVKCNQYSIFSECQQLNGAIWAHPGWNRPHRGQMWVIFLVFFKVGKWRHRCSLLTAIFNQCRISSECQQHSGAIWTHPGWNWSNRGQIGVKNIFRIL